MKQLMRVVSMWFVLFLLLLPSAVVFAAQDYRVESNLKYKLYKSGEFEQTDYSLQLGYYLKPVDVGNHPLAEAAFLERIGDVTVEGALNALDDDEIVLWPKVTLCHAEPKVDLNGRLLG